MKANRQPRGNSRKCLCDEHVSEIKQIEVCELQTKTQHPARRPRCMLPSRRITGSSVSRHLHFVRSLYCYTEEMNAEWDKPEQERTSSTNAGRRGASEASPRLGSPQSHPYRWMFGLDLGRARTHTESSVSQPSTTGASLALPGHGAAGERIRRGASFVGPRVARAWACSLQNVLESGLNNGFPYLD